MKKGNYTDSEIIAIMSKSIPQEEFKGLKIYVWKHFGKKLQEELTQKSLTKKQIQALLNEVKENPPPEPVVEKPKELTREEKQAIADQKRLNDNQYTSTIKNGVEVISLSEAGMLNIISDDHDEFEHIGEEHISDREDDGRLYINQEIKRVSDQKVFYFNYVWCPDPHTHYAMDNTLTALK